MTHPRTVERKAYARAKDRCQNPKSNGFKYYGGRGIEFRFKSFEEFFNHIGKKFDSKLTLDRINNNGHYELGNVRWASHTEQVKNRRRTKAIENFSDEELITEIRRRNL